MYPAPPVLFVCSAGVARPYVDLYASPVRVGPLLSEVGGHLHFTADLSTEQILGLRAVTRWYPQPQIGAQP
jgi:hypothetical protein